MSGSNARYAFVLAVLLLVAVYSVVHTGEVMEAPQAGSNSSELHPGVRQSSITPWNMTMEKYVHVQARDPVAMEGPPPLLAELVELDVAANSSVIDFEFSIPEGEVFLAIDGASLSNVIEVTITIYYPDLTLEEHVTRADMPLHKVIPNPPPGTYKIRLSIGVARTRAWIQVTTMNRGVATLAGMEKQYRYFTPGEARYLKVSATNSNVLLTYLRVARGGYAVFELWRLPEMILVREESVYHDYLGIFSPGSSYHLEEGEYVVCVRSVDHTDATYAVAQEHAVKYTLSLDQGVTIGYTLPYDIELFWLDIPEDLDWMSLDWSVEGASVHTSYPRVLLFSPDGRLVYHEEGYINSLNYWHYVNPTGGRYLLAVIGPITYTIVLRASSPSSVVDLTRYPTVSLNLTFTQPGQVVYLKVVSNYSFATVVNANVMCSRVSVIDSEGWVVEDDLAWDFVKSFGEWSLLKTADDVFIVRVQALKGSLILHLRSQDYVDYLVNTPDHSDFLFKYRGDLIVLGVEMRGGRYVAQSYACLNYTTRNYVWFVDSYGEVWLRDWIDYARLYILRYPYDVSSVLNGVWRVVLVSDQPGLNARLSQVQEGDEYYVSTPYHEYHTFSFDYEIRSVRIYVPTSRWAFIVAFNQGEAGRALLNVLSEELHYIAQYYLLDYHVGYTLLKDVVDEYLTIVIVGTNQANVSISLVTHNDILNVITGIETVTVPYTATVTYTTTLSTTITRTSTVANTLTETVVQPITFYAIITETHHETITVGDQPQTVFLEIPIVQTETVFEYEKVPIIHYVTVTFERDLRGKETSPPRLFNYDVSILILGAILVLQLVTIVMLARRSGKT